MYFETCQRCGYVIKSTIKVQVNWLPIAIPVCSCDEEKVSDAN